MMFMPLLWIVLIVAIVWAVVHLTQSSKPGPADRRESAREIADRRLAAGEIDAETHEQILAQLSARDPRSP